MVREGMTCLGEKTAQHENESVDQIQHIMPMYEQNRLKSITVMRIKRLWFELGALAALTCLCLLTASH